METITTDEFSQSWWRITPAGGEAKHGFGFEHEAQEYAELLDACLGLDDVNVHHVSPLSHEEFEEKRIYLESGDLGVSLEDEIIWLRGCCQP